LLEVATTQAELFKLAEESPSARGAAPQAH
jgi:hypothetical protein